MGPRALGRALVVLGAVSAVLYTTIAVPQVTLPGGALALHLAVFSLLFALYLAGVWLVHRHPEGAVRSGPAVTIVVFGLLFRGILLPTPVYLSSDLYRYLWDGRVQLAGISPYRHPPDAPELLTLRDDRVHPHINRPEARTIYPPGAQGVFALAAALGVRTVLGWRLLMLAIDGLAVAALLSVLGGHRVPLTAILIYVWSPLVVFEGVQAGHLDLVLIPLLLLALRWRQAGGRALAGVALGLAVLVKLYPAVLALAWSGRPDPLRAASERHGAETAGLRSSWRGVARWWRSRDWRFLAAVGGTVVAGYAPHLWAVGAGALGFLPEYFGPAEDHNIGLRALLTWGLGLTSSPARTATVGLFFLVLLLAVAWMARAGEAGALVETGARAVGTYLLLVPTAMHPWYVLWMVPFLCLRPSPAWLYFSGAVTLSYVAYLVAPAPIPAWAWLAQYGPLFGLLVAERWRSRARGRPVVVLPRPT